MLFARKVNVGDIDEELYLFSGLCLCLDRVQNVIPVLRRKAVARRVMRRCIEDDEQAVLFFAKSIDGR